MYNNITRTPLWTDDAVPIQNYIWSRIQLNLIPSARYYNSLSTEAWKPK